MKFLIFIVTCALAACAYTADFEDCAVRCTADMTCPENLTCGAEGLCRSAGEAQTCVAILGDAGLDALDQFPVMTTPVTLMWCTSGSPGDPTCPYNVIALNPWSPGSKIRFITQALGSDIYLIDLSVLPGPLGVYIEHPLFVSVPTTGPKVDPSDRYANVVMNLPADAPATMLGAGSESPNFDSWAADPIAIYFKAIGVMR